MKSRNRRNPERHGAAGVLRRPSQGVRELPGFVLLELQDRIRRSLLVAPRRRGKGSENLNPKLNTP